MKIAYSGNGPKNASVLLQSRNLRNHNPLAFSPSFFNHRQFRNTKKSHYSSFQTPVLPEMTLDESENDDIFQSDDPDIHNPPNMIQTFNSEKFHKQNRSIPMIPFLPKISRSSPSNLKAAKNESNEQYNDGEKPSTLKIIASIQTDKKFNLKLYEYAKLQCIVSLGGPEFQKLFDKKVELCSYIFNFNGIKAEEKGKALKLATLIELEKLFSKKKSFDDLSEANRIKLFNMIYANIYNQDPLITKKLRILSAENIIDPSWEHLSHVFTIFFSYFNNLSDDKRFNFELAKKTLILLNLPDPNVRENLLSFLKSYIQKRPSEIFGLVLFCKNCLRNVIEGIYTPFCVSSILSFLTLILSSNKPFNREVQNLIIDGVFPLMHCNQMNYYSEKFYSFISHVLVDEEALQEILLVKILKTFPVQSGSKQTIYLTTLITLIKIASDSVLNVHVHKILNLLEQCLDSPNSKAVQEILKMWTNDIPLTFLSQNHKITIPKLLPSIMICSTNHWSKNVQNLAQEALKTMRRQNIATYVSTIKDLNAQVKGLNSSTFHELNDSLSKWASIFRAASRYDHSLDLNELLKQARFTYSSINSQKDPNRLHCLSFALERKKNSNVVLKGMIHRSSSLSQKLLT